MRARPRKEKARGEILNVPLFPLFSRRHAALNRDPSAFVSPPLFPLALGQRDATRSDKTEIRAAFPPPESSTNRGRERERGCADNRSSSPSRHLHSKPDYPSCDIRFDQQPPPSSSSPRFLHRASLTIILRIISLLFVKKKSYYEIILNSTILSAKRRNHFNPLFLS